MLILFLLATIFLSFWRARQYADFWPTFFIEPGFATLLLHYSYFNQAFEENLTYLNFIIDWVLPVVGSCIVAFGVGHWLAMRKLGKANKPD